MRLCALKGGLAKCCIARRHGAWVQAGWQGDLQAGDPHLNRGDHAHQPRVCHCDGALTRLPPTRQHAVGSR